MVFSVEVGYVTNIRLKRVWANTARYRASIAALRSIIDHRLVQYGTSAFVIAHQRGEIWAVTLVRKKMLKQLA